MYTKVLQYGKNIKPTFLIYIGSSWSGRYYIIFYFLLYQRNFAQKTIEKRKQITPINNVYTLNA